MFTTLVVPLDGSDLAAEAIDAAVAIGLTRNAGLRLLGVARNNGELTWMRDHVRDAARKIDAISVPDADVVIDPDPVSALLAVAAEPGTLLCFASRDHLPIAAKARHSVGSALMVRAQQPFVVVGARPTTSAQGVDVVVALDGVSDPHRLLSTAVSCARQLDAPLRIVTVYEPVLADLRRPSHFTRHHGPPNDPDEYLDAARRGVEAHDFAAVSTASIADPVSVSAGLAQHVATRPARLLVVGGRHAGVHLGAGVARELLRSSALPILVVNHGATPTHA